MSTSSGKAAEDQAASYLEAQGYTILMRNWRTRLCEIDIVAQKNDCVYLVEVKYRRSSAQGYGVDYITPRKLKQMAFAAELWAQAHTWQGDYRLAAISVDGSMLSLIEID